MKRKVFIISRSGGLKDHLIVKKSLLTKNIKSSIINIDNSQHEKLLRKCGKDILIFQDSNSCSFYALKKMLFRNKTDFFTFGRMTPETLSFTQGNFDIGFNKDSIRKVTETHIAPQFPELSYNVAIDVPPEAVPYKYLGYFRSTYLLTNSLISFLSKFETPHKKIKIIAPTRPYDLGITNAKILEISSFMGERAEIISDLSCIEKGSTILTWSTKRYLLFLSMGFRPVILTKCLASSALFTKNCSLSQMFTTCPESKIPELYQTLESIKLENGLRIIYKLLQ